MFYPEATYLEQLVEGKSDQELRRFLFKTSERGERLGKRVFQSQKVIKSKIYR